MEFGFSGTKIGPDYCCVYATPTTWVLPEAFQVGKYSGLVSVRVVRLNGADTHLFAEWVSQKDFEHCSRSVFEKELEVSKLIFSGYCADFKFRERPWWANLATAYSILVTIIAVGTNLEKLGDLFGAVFGAPKASVISEQKALLVATGGGGEIKLNARNESESKVTLKFGKWTIKAEGAGDSTGFKVNSTPTSFALPGLGSQVINVPFVATTRGNFIIECEYSVSGGILRSDINGLISSSRVEVWAGVENPLHARLSEHTEFGAIFILEARHGRILGNAPLSYQCSMLESDGCKFDLVNPGDVTERIPGTDSAVIRWSYAGTPLVRQDFSISVSSDKPRIESFWKNLKIETYVEP